MTAEADGWQVLDSQRFSIRYRITGPGAVDAASPAVEVIEPGSEPPVRLASLPAGGAPRYVSLAAFWLERALGIFSGPPYSLRDPTASGRRIPVTIDAYPGSAADPVRGVMLPHAASDSFLALQAVHETFHMVQYQYLPPGTLGPWFFSLFEGAAACAEDAVVPRLKRYLYLARAGGLLAEPAQSLVTARYNASLFWRYLLEQAAVGPAAALGRFLEAAFTGTFSTADLRATVRTLRPEWTLDEFAYADPSRREVRSSETALGNFALTCYVKDLPAPPADPRFRFLEEDAAVGLARLLDGEPAPRGPGAVLLSGHGTVAPGGPPAVFEDEVEAFAHRFYEVTVDPALPALDVAFRAGAGLTSLIFQLVLVDDAGGVSDIHRTDAPRYRKRLAAVRGERRLSRVALIVSGAASRGAFRVAVSPTRAVCKRPRVVLLQEHEATE